MSELAVKNDRGISIVNRIDTIDENTGEVLHQIEKTKKVRKHKGFVMYKSRYRFAKMFLGEKPNFEVSSHLGYFYELVHHVEALTNIIVVMRGGIYRTAQKEDIKNMINISESTYQRFMCESRNIGSIATFNTKDRCGYMVNPAYAYNGFGIDPIVYRVFELDEIFIKSLDVGNIEELEAMLGGGVRKHIRKNFPQIYKLKYNDWRNVE